MKVGDYVRTEDGHIDKIVKISDEMKSCRTIKVQIGEKDIIGGYEDFVDWFSPSHFIKSSPDIIDLIEVGDYVNGKKVLNVAIDYIFDYSEEIKIVYFDKDKKDYIYSKVDIKSIVTKEQFSQMEYKIGEWLYER